MTSQPDGLNYFTRLETSYHDMDEASAVTPFIASSYYQIPGESRIHSSTSDSYSKPIFTQHLWAVLKEWKPQGSTIIAYDPTKTSPFFNDEVKGSVFFGEKSESPDATKCLNNYEHDQEDNWPDDEEIWFSQCSYFEEKNFLYLALQSFWSARLKASALEETKLIHLSQGKIAQVTYSATGFSIQLGNDQAAGPDFNLDLKPEEARPLIVEAVKKAGTMKARFFILEKNKDGLKGSEKITGKLVMKRTRMRDEIDLIDIQ
jgi:hypothetical protein